MLQEDEKKWLVQLLKDYIDVFAWSFHDMPGLDPEVACHKLNLDPSFPPVQQKRRKISSAVAEAVNQEEEVDRLLEAKFLREVQYPEWLANIVSVPKKNGKIRVCIDFTDLNKATPKDPFPLPIIDELVDSTAGHAMLSFMDGYFCYNQIPPR